MMLTHSDLTYTLPVCICARKARSYRRTPGVMEVVGAGLARDSSVNRGQGPFLRSYWRLTNIPPSTSSDAPVT